MKRPLAATFVVGAAIGLSGCQSTTSGGLSFFNWNGSSGSTAPDVSKQKYSGLSQQVAANDSASTGMGGNRAPQKTGVFASLSKSTAAATSALTGKKTAEADEDPLHLGKSPKKIGPDVYVAAARLLENQGKFGEAEDKYREALRSSPNDLNALVGLGRLYDRQGQGQKAVEIYQRAGQAYPTNALVFNDLGLCLRRQRQVDKSVLAFRKAVELAGDNAKYRNNLAAALVDAGKTNEAYEQFAASSSPAVAHYNVAFLLQQKGDRASAIQHLQQAVGLDTALTPARDLLVQLGAATPVATVAAEQPAPRLATEQAAPRAAIEQQAVVATVEQSAPATTPSALQSPQPQAAQPQVAAQQPQLPAGAYSAGASSDQLYTSAPQISPATTSAAPAARAAD